MSYDSPFMVTNMAYINNLYVLVEEESVENDVETVMHPTESGIPTADTIRRKPIVINLTGVIADAGSSKSDAIIKKLKELQDKGTIITYRGACGVYGKLQIQTFYPNYTHKVNGGATFSMTLQEMRTAKSAYVKTKSAGTQQVQKSSTPKPIYYTVKKGDTIWDLCHSTYKSQDLSVSEVIRDNPSAFSRKGDARTLQIGTRICLKQ